MIFFKLINFDQLYVSISLGERVKYLKPIGNKYTLLKSYLSFAIKLMVEACDKLNWMLYYFLRKHAAGESTFCNNPKVESL